MRILFLECHPMWVYALPHGFYDLGHQVMISGIALWHKNFKKAISEFGPDLIITMGWGPINDSLEKQTFLGKIIKASGVPHAYWATEDPTHTSTFTLLYISRVQPDFVFTICPIRVTDYISLGIKAAHLDFGYHPAVHGTGPSVPLTAARSPWSLTPTPTD